MFRRILYLFLVLLVGMIIFNSSSPLPGDRPESVPISVITKAIEAGQVKKISVNGIEIAADLEDGRLLRGIKEEGSTLADYGITADKVTIEIKDNTRGAAAISLLSAIIPVLIIAGFIYFLMRSAQGSNMRALNFGRSRAKLYEGGRRVTFRDVAGLKEAKQELSEVVDFLKSPEKFRRIGAEIPKGVLLIGPPGVGKTMLAKAVAGEAGVPFFTISASEFVEMFVGVGASRVRDLFAKAKRNAPDIIFIDELDAIGRQRGAGLGGSHDEREQTLNQILVEMDGFDTDTNVIVVAATNRPDVLDPALMRPGRFDRRVALDLPDRPERLDILVIHAKSKIFEEAIDLDKIARQTAGFSGADLKNLMNEAAIIAVRRGKKKISQLELEEAIEKVLLGPERRSRVLSLDEKKVTAYHEAGHAIVSHVLPGADPVHKVSIISRGMALGYTWNIPQEERHLHSKSKFVDEIAMMLGGRLAELQTFNEATTGASNDLKRATQLARRMVTEFGMSEKLGHRTYGERSDMVFLGRDIHEQRDYSEKVAAEIDDEVGRIISAAEKLAREVLIERKSILKNLAEALLEKETIDGQEFAAFFKKIDETRDDDIDHDRQSGRFDELESQASGSEIGLENDVLSGPVSPASS